MIASCSILSACWNSKASKYVLLSGYIAILFGRSRQTEDIDLVIEDLDEQRFRKLWKALHAFECLNTNNPHKAFKEYLCNKTAIRFSRPHTYIPNMELKFAHQAFESEALERRVKVVLDEHVLFISPLELQIAFKLFLGSEKDIEDAKHLHILCKEYLNNKLFHSYLHALRQEENAKRFLND